MACLAKRSVQTAFAAARACWRSALKHAIGLAAGVSCLAGPPYRAWAEDDERAERPPDGLEEIVILAEARSPLVFAPAPIEMQVLDRSEIESLPNLSAADAVAKLPGIRTQQRIQGERAAVSIEGLPPEYTKILVNGQRYTGLVGSVADFEDVPLTNIDRIEILRGAQGLRHGPDAGGGVINVLTSPTPEDATRAEAWGVGGSDGKFLLAATAAAGVGPWGGDLSYTHDELAGYDPRGSDAVFVGVGGKDSRRRVDDLYLNQELGRWGPLGGFARFGYREEDERYVRPSGAYIGTDTSDRWIGSAGGDWQPSDALSVATALTYYQGDAVGSIARPTEIADRELRGELSTTAETALGPAQLDITLGLDVRELIFELKEAPLPFTPQPGAPALSGNRDFRKYATTGGAFAELEAELATWLRISAGVRTQLDTRYEPNYAPQLGLLLEPCAWLDLRLQYGRSDRYPSLDDLYKPEVAQLGGLYYLAGNAELVPEQTHSWRAGFEIAPLPDLAWSATAYWNEIDGLIRSLFDGQIQTGVNTVFRGGNPPPFCRFLGNDYLRFPDCSPVPIPFTSPVRSDLFRLQNLDSVRTRGVESQLYWSPLEWLVLRAGYTYTDSKVDSERLPDLEQLPNEPPHTLDLEGRVTLPSPGRWIGAAQLGGVARYRSEALAETSGTGLAGFTSNERTRPSWVADLRLTLPVADSFTLNFDVRNLTNEETVDSYEIRGRSYYAGLRVRWPAE